MKYCPYCGTILPGGAVFFCPECGNALPGVGETGKPGIEKREKPRIGKEKKVRKTEKRKREKEIPAAMDQYRLAEEIQPEDDGYDGYYDDIRPVDEEVQREGIDTALIWKIAALVAGLLVVVGACVALMYFL